MKNTELAYDYRSICSIMDSRGFSIQEIESFLKANQNESGYIVGSLIPTN